MKFKRNLLSAALASATMMVAVPAFAQDNSTDAAKDKDKASTTTNVGTVKVRGIRRGIEASISTKKNSNEIVEAVSAEDIGKLPDSSIAESIARLPGLAAQRVAGRAQVISVRGLSPDFATTLLNGREVVSTGDNRSVEFDQYPSELMAGVTVYKTPQAGLIGQGLSGTIDMRTVRPLNFPKPVVSVGGRFQSNSLGSAANRSGDGNRVNASYIGQFANRTIGVAIGVAHSQTPVQEEQVGLYEPWQAIGAGWRPDVPEGTYYADGIKALRRTGYNKRDAVMATLEFRPNSVWHSTLDTYFTKAHQEDTANQFEVHVGDYNGGYGRIHISPYTINGNNTFTGGTAANLYPLVRGMYNDRKDIIRAFGWSNDFDLDNVKLFTDLSWSKATRKELNLENNTQLAPDANNGHLETINLSYQNDGFSQIVPTVHDYSDPSKLYLRGTIYGSGYGKVPEVNDELKSAKIAAQFNAPESMSQWMTGITVGYNHADRQKTKQQPEGNINVGSQGDTTIASDLQYSPVDLSFAGIGYIPSWNVPGAVARYMTFKPAIDQPYLLVKSWSLSEKIDTAYVKADIDATLDNGVVVKGNIGVQAQHVNQSSSANSRVNNSTLVPVTLGKTYTDYLPSANLAFLFANDQTLRLALAKQVARPRMDQMNASVGMGVDDGTGKTAGGGGNPLLDPWRSTAFDVSYEKYFGDKAYISAAYFYKRLSSYIYTQTVDGYDWSAYVAQYDQPAPAPGQTFPPINPIGTFSAPMNGKGGMLQGLEVTASLPLSMLTPALDGFGIVASASYNDSAIKIVDPESASSVGKDPIALPGLSKNVFNLTAYYEKNGFEARVSQRRRSDYIGEIGNFNGSRTLRYVVGENITDAQIGYSFPDTSDLKGLSLQLQAQNLGNAAYRTYAGTKDRPLEYIKWGRTIVFGVNYKF